MYNRTNENQMSRKRPQYLWQKKKKPNENQDYRTKRKRLRQNWLKKNNHGVWTI